MVSISSRLHPVSECPDVAAQYQYCPSPRSGRCSIPSCLVLPRLASSVDHREQSLYIVCTMQPMFDIADSQLYPTSKSPTDLLHHAVVLYHSTLVTRLSSKYTAGSNGIPIRHDRYAPFRHSRPPRSELHVHIQSPCRLWVIHLCIPCVAHNQPRFDWGL